MIALGCVLGRRPAMKAMRRWPRANRWFIANRVPAEPSRPGHGMALKHVRERLRLMHDVAAQFAARQDKDVFRVQIVVPL